MGATIAVIVLPRNASWQRRVITAGAFVALANVPDYPIPNWGHDRYDISHSVFSLAVIMVPLLLLVLSVKRLRNWVGGTKVAIGGFLAVYGHLLLDSMYNHGRGIAIFWPFGDGRLVLPVPWFDVLKVTLPTITAHSMRVMGIELMAYGALFLIVLFARRLWLGKAT